MRYLIVDTEADGEFLTDEESLAKLKEVYDEGFGRGVAFANDWEGKEDDQSIHWDDFKKTL